jgi:uncharacterized RmlC-like cupin family protein
MTRIVVQRTLGVSPVHHHAESEACVYGLRGRSAFFFGSELRERIDIGEGDFVFIPAWAIHAEMVLSADPFDCVMARSTPDPRSVNLPALHVPEEVLDEARLSAA